MLYGLFNLSHAPVPFFFITLATNYYRNTLVAYKYL